MIDYINKKVKQMKVDPNKLEQAITLYKSGIPLMKASSLAGIGSVTLQKYLKKLNLTRSNKINSRKYHLNHNFFEKIESELQAYWLGFIYADGYVSKKKYDKCLGIAIHEKDESHLKKFKTAINSTYPIKHYTSFGYGIIVNYVRLFMTSDKIFDDLKNLGVFEKKSLILKFPTEQMVPKPFVHHFIRGYFDGDGSFARAAKHNKQYTFKLCGTKELLKQVEIEMGFENTRKLSKRYKDKKNNYCLEIGGRLQVIKIGDYMYKDATIYLERKYERYIGLKNQ